MSPSVNSTTEKAVLRTQMLSLRHSIPAPERLAAAQAIANHFADHPYLTYAASFAGYYAIRGELDTLPVFNRMARFNKVTGLPAIADEGLQFRLWKPGEPLHPAAHGTKEPLENAASYIPEVILTPLLAFDAQGNRLGYGGGYYDRYMRKIRAEMEKPPLFVGVGFARQEAKDIIPTEPQDEKLDGIMTEEGVSVFR